MQFGSVGAQLQPREFARDGIVRRQFGTVHGVSARAGVEVADSSKRPAPRRLAARGAPAYTPSPNGGTAIESAHGDAASAT
jgi:hypothetical protein